MSQDSTEGNGPDLAHQAFVAYDRVSIRIGELEEHLEALAERWEEEEAPAMSPWEAARQLREALRQAQDRAHRMTEHGLDAT